MKLNFKNEPKFGMISRSEIGILYWDSKEDDKNRTHVTKIEIASKNKKIFYFILI